MSNRLLGRDLKSPDEFESIFGKWMHYPLSNLKWTGSILGATLLVWGVSIVLEMHQEKIDRVAANSFQKIVELYREEGSKTDEEKIKDIDQFLSKNKASSMASLTELLKGKSLLSTGKYLEAEVNYRAARSKMKFPYSVLADEGVAFSLMEQKKWDAAISEWSKLASNKDNPLRADHLWKLGMTQEAAGKKKEAI